MRRVRLMILVAAMFMVAMPVARAQFGGFGGSQGFSSGGSGDSGSNGGGTVHNIGPGYSFIPGQQGQQGAGSDEGAAGQPATTVSDEPTTTTTTPAPQAAANNDWACPAGYTPWLDDAGNWVKDDNGTPQCLPTEDVGDAGATSDDLGTVDFADSGS